MQIHLSPGDGRPIYKQIIDQVRYMVGAGRLQPGDEMPSVRVLAQQILVNPNTVARAYRELEAMGLLASRQGSGTVVTNGGSPLAKRERQRILTDRVDALLAEARQLSFSVDEVKQLLDERADGISKENEQSA